jgi:hypothetical protein
MSEADHLRDERFRQMLEKFLNDMVSVHCFSFAQAQRIATEEIKRAYDERFKIRRSRLTVIEGGGSAPNAE